MNPDLKVVGGFWSAAIGDMKSLKSKNFNFRSKVKLEKDVPSTLIYSHFQLFKLCSLLVVLTIYSLLLLFPLFTSLSGMV